MLIGIQQRTWLQTGHRVVVRNQPIELADRRPNGFLGRQPPQTGTSPAQLIIERRQLQLAPFLLQKPVRPPTRRSTSVQIGNRLALAGEIVEESTGAGLADASLGDRLTGSGRVRAKWRVQKTTSAAAQTRLV